jgi:hypothetical protein
MRWEYQTFKIEPGGFLGGKVNLDGLQSSLDHAGAEGWELVSTFQTSQGQRTREVVFVFKRPVPGS